ncbi:MAG: hypothetical protein EHM39_02385 [Chloroflexi bacterium]|nr:MAG: hypothetical protein EHM39_02385 [Chloroflexota bacterium]
MNIRRLVYSVAAIALATSALVIATPALAQGPGTGIGFGANYWVVEACSTTDYASVVGEALGITAPELRQALAGGQSISDLADDNDVELSAVSDAVSAARSSDIDAALAAGLLTEDEAQALRDLLSGEGLTIMPGLRRGLQSQQDPSDDEDESDDRPFRLQIHMPEGLEDLMLELMPGGMFRFGMGFGGLGGRGLTQQVKAYQVAATALGTSCAELVQQVLDGSSIAEVASQTDGGVQIVTDALVAAHETAIDTALGEGLISQVEADSQKADVLNRVLMEISRSDGGRGWGFGFRGGELREELGSMMGGMMNRLRGGLDLGSMMDELGERFGMGGMMGGRGQRGR